MATWQPAPKSTCGRCGYPKILFKEQSVGAGEVCPNCNRFDGSGGARGLDAASSMGKTVHTR